MTRAGGIDLPGEIMGPVALAEVVIHGWDVARAIGAPTTATRPPRGPGAPRTVRRGGHRGHVRTGGADRRRRAGTDRVIALSGVILGVRERSTGAMDPVVALRQIAYYKDRAREDSRRVMAYRNAADIVEALSEAERERHGAANSWQSFRASDRRRRR